MNFQIRPRSQSCCFQLMKQMIPKQLSYTTDSIEPVVISGVSCRLPDCDSFAEFGKMLRQGEDFTGEQKRFLSTRAPPRCGYLRHLSKFDAAFFKMPPRLAEASDPQLRMLLEVVLESIIDAG